jgi:hypothetical protein
MNRRAASSVGAKVEIHVLIQRLADEGKAVVKRQLSWPAMMV